MEAQGAQTLAVTSPTSGCGKTVNIINLAMGIARLPERSVLLIDLDLNGPQISRRLGLNCEVGLIDVLDGTVAYQDALVQARVGSHEFLVLPSKGTSAANREWPSAKTLAALLRDLKQEDKSRIILLDLPPLLSGDEVISLLPYVDGVLFVVSAGVTTQAHLKECGKHLQASSLVRVVLNKSPEPTVATYGNYEPGRGRAPSAEAFLETQTSKTPVRGLILHPQRLLDDTSRNERQQAATPRFLGGELALSMVNYGRQYDQRRAYH